MNDLDFACDLQDRIAKILAINEQYDLLNNAYISFSGGKDSVVLSHLIDIALPGNDIPRVFANTGIEYLDMVRFVKSIASTDKRFVILNQTRNIKNTLNDYGYPFKSKEHSLRVYVFHHGSTANSIKYYIDYSIKKGFKCPKILLYQFSDTFYNYSNKCCYKLKKDLVHAWQIKNHFKICITGMRSSEGGARKNLSCLTNNGKKFHPLIVVSDDWESEFIRRYDIKLCKLYYAPFNFKRTGCKGCPFNLHLQDDLDILYKLLPNEYYQCIYLWKSVYDEYIRIGYRLKYYPHLRGVQMSLFDYEELENQK